MAGTGPASGEHLVAREQRDSQVRAARAGLVDLLRETLGIGDPVAAAFGQVPRHLFLPELPPLRAYADDAVVIKVDGDGIPVSSSSQPTMMAIMLDQLALGPGHRVLEIGSGTGYNAALMAQITGSGGNVVSVDIDPTLTARASASLAAAGYGQVRVVCTDGASGFAAQAPYDRIIVTVGAWDVAPEWLDQLAPGGRLVLPLSIRGIQLSVALDRAGDLWLSQSMVRCGFIRMAGALAGPEVFVPAGPQPGLRIETDDGRPLDPGPVYAALAEPPVARIAAELAAVSDAELSDVDVWLTLAEPELVRLTVLGAGRVPAAAARTQGWLAGTGPATGALGLAAVIPLRDEPPEPAGEPDPAASGEDEPYQDAPVQDAPYQDAPEQDAPDPDLEGRGYPGTRGHGRTRGRGRGAAGPPRPAQGIAVLGHGPGGADLAGYLAARAGTWHRLGRPGISDLELAVYPAGTRAEPAGSALILRRPHVVLALHWRDRPAA